MKIVASFSDTAEIGPLCDAGADELYCAVEGLPAFGYGLLRGGLKAAARLAHARGRKLSLAANSLRLNCSRPQLLRLAARLEKAAADGADSLIISSPSVFSLFETLGRPLPLPVHLSSVQPVFNSRSARWFIRLGVSRIILPSQVAPLEALELLKECRRAGVETEIFDYRVFGCSYVNGRCNLHGPVYHTFRSGREASAICRCGAGTPGRLQVKPADITPGRGAEVPALARRLYSRMTGGGPPRLYNAASFYDFYSLGVDYLKYGIRGDPPGEKVRKVRMLRELLDAADEISAAVKDRAEARRAFIHRLTGWRGGREAQP